MVKLTRILKSEYRDDLGSRRSRKSNKRKTAVENLNTNSPFRDDGTQGTTRKEELTLPPTLLKIIESQAGQEVQGEKRDAADPKAHNRTSGENPHHFALTRAAQMALRTLPMPAEADDTSVSSTMALIDSIVKTSDDPALIEALQAMITNASGQSVEQRETLALVAESIMEKKAAKEALQRAVLAESRLHESLKKCAPEVAGDAAAVVAAAEGSDHPATPSSFFNRINKSLTSSSQSGHMRKIPFVKSRSKGHKSDVKNKNAKNEVDDSTPQKNEDPVEQERNAASEDLEDPTEESTAEDSTVVSIKVQEEERDDVEQAPGERESNVNDGSVVTGQGTPPKRMNKYKNIASIQRDTLVRFTRPPSRNSQAHEVEQYNNMVGAAAESEIEVYTSVEEAGEGTLVEVDEESAYESESEETDGEGDHYEDDADFTEGEGDEADDPTISNFEIDDSEKIEYTIFELESKLSLSTRASSLASASSCSSHTDDHDDGDHTDNENNFTEAEEEAGDEATNEATGDEVSYHDGEETAASGTETGSDEESEESSDDDDGGFLFSFCHRPDSSFDVDGNNDDEDDYDNERDSRHKSHRHSRRTKEVPSVLRCVSGYFVGDGEDVETEEREKRRRRRRERHRRHRHRHRESRKHRS